MRPGEGRILFSPCRQLPSRPVSQCPELQTTAQKRGSALVSGTASSVSGGDAEGWGGLESRGSLAEGRAVLECQAGPPAVPRLTFHAEVAFQAHGPFISLLSFNVLHPRLDDGRWSWGAHVPSVSWKETELCHFPRPPHPPKVRGSHTELAVEQGDGHPGGRQPREAAGATGREGDGRARGNCNLT